MVTACGDRLSGECCECYFTYASFCCFVLFLVFSYCFLISMINSCFDMFVYVFEVVTPASLPISGSGASDWQMKCNQGWMRYKCVLDSVAGWLL